MVAVNDEEVGGWVVGLVDDGIVVPPQFVVSVALTGSSHICTKLLLKACPLEIMRGRGKNFSVIRWIGHSGGRGDDGNHLTLKDQDPIILGDIDEVPVQQFYQFLKSMATCTQCFNFQWCFTITLFDFNLLQLGERIKNV